MRKPTYNTLVEALRKVKSNGTRLRYETRHLVNCLLAEIDKDEEPDEPAVDDQPNPTKEL